jgi:predicted ATPase
MNSRIARVCAANNQLACNDPHMTAPYLRRTYLRSDRALDASTYPGCIPFVPKLDVAFTSTVTFFVGENGSGKSSLLEALVSLSGLPVAGGSKNDLADGKPAENEASLAHHLHISFAKRPRHSFFFRAELQAHLANRLDERFVDPHFRETGNPYDYYGGQSLHTRSHGEAFLAVLNNQLKGGLYFLDEPESALSPQRQLALLAAMHRSEKEGAQFVIATHSPILLTYPGARILSFDGGVIAPIALVDTPHYQITRGILEHPERYWRHLRES